MGPMVGLDGCRESRPTRDFFCIFLYSACTSCVLVFCVLTVLHFAICLYLEHTTQISIPSAGFEPAIQAGERLQTYTLNRAATGIRSLDCPARSESQYRLSHSGPSFVCACWISITVFRQTVSEWVALDEFEFSNF